MLGAVGGFAMIELEPNSADGPALLTAMRQHGAS